MKTKQIERKVNQIAKHLGVVRRLSGELSDPHVVVFTALAADANALNLLCSHAKQHLDGLHGHVYFMQKVEKTFKPTAKVAVPFHVTQTRRQRLNSRRRKKLVN